MRFFSKITAICNIFFIIYVVLWFVEMHNRKVGSSELVIPLSWLEGTSVILGYLSIVVNTLFLLLCFIFYSFKSNIKVPRWILIFNIIIFCCQVYWHFIFKDMP